MDEIISLIIILKCVAVSALLRLTIKEVGTCALPASLCFSELNQKRTRTLSLARNNAGSLASQIIVSGSQQGATHVVRAT